MQNRIKIAFALSLLLGACSKQHEPSPAPLQGEGAMSFSVDVTSTRALSATSSNLSEFGVFCYNTEYNLWDDVKNTAVPNKMSNQKVNKIEQEWVYNPPVMWEGGSGHRFTFFAYSPYATGARTVDNPAGNGVTIKKEADGTLAPGSLVVQYTPVENAEEQVDLLVANQMKNLKAQSSVKVNFSHALVKVGFKAYCLTPGTRIDSIVITGSPVTGDYDLYTGQWTIDPSVTGRYAFRQPTPVTTNAANPTFVSDPGNFFMLLPKDFTNNSEAKISITYTNSDYPNSVTKEYQLKENWQISNAYIYTVELGGNPSAALQVESVDVIPWNVDATNDPFETGVMLDLNLYANDGTGNVTVEKRPAGSLRELPTPTTTTGKTFYGWNTAADYSGKLYAPGAKYRMGAVAGTYNLYAQWEAPKEIVLDAAERITWDATLKQYKLTNDPTDGGLFFAAGGVVGIFSGNDAIRTLPDKTAYPFGANTVAWKPFDTEINQLDNLPCITSYEFTHNATNIKKGLGDPCRLVGLDLANIKNTPADQLTENDIDNHTWRLPTAGEYLSSVVAPDHLEMPTMKNGVYGRNVTLTVGNRISTCFCPETGNISGRFSSNATGYLTSTVVENYGSPGVSLLNYTNHDSSMTPEINKVWKDSSIGGYLSATSARCVRQ